MNNLKAYICKKTKKISYPQQVNIELLFAAPVVNLSLVTNEIRAGDILLIKQKNQILNIYKIENNKINQIHGNSNDEEAIIELSVSGYDKVLKIKEYLFWMFKDLALKTLIEEKHDLEDLENGLTEYLLNCKSANRIDMRKIRSLIFKSCKNTKLCEKLYFLFDNNRFNYFEWKNQILKIDFNNLIVQFSND